MPPAAGAGAPRSSEWRAAEASGPDKNLAIGHVRGGAAPAARRQSPRRCSIRWLADRTLAAYRLGRAVVRWGSAGPAGPGGGAAASACP